MTVQVTEASRTSQSIGDKGPFRTGALSDYEGAERKGSSETFALFLQVYSSVKHPIATEGVVLNPNYMIKLNIIATVKERFKSGYKLFVTKIV